MDDYESAGLEAHIEEDAWADLAPVRGNVVEVYMADSDWPGQPEEWAAFLVVRVALSLGGGFVLEVKFLGAQEGPVKDELMSHFERKAGTIHLCVAKPCLLDDLHNIHATRVRLFKFEDFEPPYLGSAGKSRARRLYNGLNPAKGDEADVGKGHMEPKPKVVPRKGAIREESKPKKKAKRDGQKKKHPDEDPEERLHPATKAELKDKLAALRARLSGGSHAKEKEQESEEPDGEGVEEIPSSAGEESNAARGDWLKTGTQLVLADPQRGDGKKKRRAKRKKLREEATSVISTKGLQGKLVQRAVAAQGTSGKGQEKKSGKALATQMTKAFVKILTKSSGKKRKKDKKEKGRKKGSRRKKAGGGDPSDGDGDGSDPTSSSEDDFDGTSEDEDSSTEKEYEAPLRRRSKTKPGSVLEMLLQHAQDQLDQSATVPLPAGRQADAGIKLVSYFQILLRPQLGQPTSAVREMYHICVVLDLLRRGQLDLMGDSLAARFLALHQSILDGSWTAAKHLEIHALEEMSAASTSLLLETRRHAKLAAKAIGLETPPWGKGKRGKYGHGGKGKGEEGWNQKGKAKDKGSKGKGRGGWNAGNPQKDEWSKKGGDWGQQKEPPADK